MAWTVRETSLNSFTSTTGLRKEGRSIVCEIFGRFKHSQHVLLLLFDDESARAGIHNNYSLLGVMGDLKV